MKISEITVEKLKEYMRVDNSDEDIFIESSLVGAKAYIKNYTGLTNEQIEEKEDFTLVIYVLCSEMYDNRLYTVEKAIINPIIKSILDMHSVNLL